MHDGGALAALLRGHLHDLRDEPAEAQASYRTCLKDPNDPFNARTALESIAWERLQDV